MPTFPVGPASRARGITRPSSLAGLQCLSRGREFAGGAEAGAEQLAILEFRISIKSTEIV